MRRFGYQPQHLKSQPTLRSRAMVPVASFALAAGLGLGVPFIAAPQVAFAAEGTSVTQQSGDVTKTVWANENENQTINGNVTVIDDSDEEYPPGAFGVENYGSEVTVKGDVTAESKNGYAAGVTGSAGSSTTVEGDVSAKGADAVSVQSVNGASVDVGGDVSAEGANWANGVTVNGEDSTANVAGDVSAKGDSATGVSAYEGVSVDVGGNVSAEGGYANGVNAYEGASVDVAGEVSAEGDYATGVYSVSGASVGVGGDVTAAGELEATGVSAQGDGANSAVTVDGSVTAKATAEDGTGTGAYLWGDSTVVINGDLTGSTTGAYLVWSAGADSDAAPTLAVSGTVTGSESAITVWYYPYYQDAETGEEVKVATEDLPTPTILVGALKVTNSDGTLVRVLVYNGDLEEEIVESEELEAAILKSVSYIVDAGEGVTVTGATTKTVEVNGEKVAYTVAHAGDTVTVTDADGTRTVKVVDGGREGGGTLSFTGKADEDKATVKQASAPKHLAASSDALPQTGDSGLGSVAGVLALAGVAAVLGGAHFARRRDA